MITQGATLVEEAMRACHAPQTESFFSGQLKGCGNAWAAGWEFFSAWRRGREEAASAMK